MILRRVTTAGCIGFGIVATGRVTPSIRARTTISSSCGSKWMSEAPSSIACAIVVWTSFTAGALAPGLGDLLALGGALELGVLDGLLLLLDLDLRPVEGLDRALEVGRLGDGEAHVVAERQAQVVGAADVRGVGDGDEQEVVGEEAHRDGLVAERELLLQKGRRVAVGLRLGEVDVLEPELVGERLARSALVTQLWPTAISPSRRPVRRCSSKACLTCSTVSSPRLISREPRCCQGRWAASTGAISSFSARNMKAVVQRVSGARVRVREEVAGEIGPGLCVLLGVARGDDAAVGRASGREGGAAAGLRERRGPIRPLAARHRRRGARREPVHADRGHREGQSAELLRGRAARGGGAALRGVLRGAPRARRPRGRPACSAREWRSSSRTTGRSRSCSSLARPMFPALTARPPASINATRVSGGESVPWPLNLLSVLTGLTIEAGSSFTWGLRLRLGSRGRGATEPMIALPAATPAAPKTASGRLPPGRGGPASIGRGL